MSSEDRTVPPTTQYEIVAIASSAGGIGALGKVLGGLPARFAVPVVVVQHLDPRHETIIAEVLGRRTPLIAKLAVEGEKAVPGTVYIAPPNRHLLVGRYARLSLTTGERVHYLRPSADLLFESTAESFGPRVLACVLTGTGQDGSAGVSAIKAHGGTVIVEDPASAEFKGMPESAVASGAADFVVPLGEIAGVIRELVEVEKP